MFSSILLNLILTKNSLKQAILLFSLPLLLSACGGSEKNESVADRVDTTQPSEQTETPSDDQSNDDSSNDESTEENQEDQNEENSDQDSTDESSDSDNNTENESDDTTNIPETLTIQVASQNTQVEINASTLIVLQATASEEVSLAYEIVVHPTQGTLSGTAPNLTYTPNQGFTGVDSFTYKAAYENVESNSATVQIQVIDSSAKLASIFVETSDLRSRDVDYEVALAYDRIEENGKYPKAAGDYYHWQENAENYIEVGYRTGKAIHEAGYLTKNDNADTLKIFLMAGQSNMEGKGRCYESDRPRTNEDGTPAYENIAKGTLDYLYNNNEYLLSLKDKTNSGQIVGQQGDRLYTFLDQLNTGDQLTVDYLTARNDAWVVNYDSLAGSFINKSGLFPDFELGDAVLLQPGLDNATGNRCGYGIELAMGHYLAERYSSPILMYKSAKGGMSLSDNFRPVSAVSKREGDVGDNYTNTVESFSAFIEALNPADFGASQFEIAGFIWLQGWNDRGSETQQQEYLYNVVDLVNDVRVHIQQPALPAVLIASPHQNGSNDLNITQAKRDAVTLLNNLAENKLPTITKFDASKQSLTMNESISLIAEAVDEDGDSLELYWSVSHNAENPSITLDVNASDKKQALFSTDKTGEYKISFWAADGKDQVRKTVLITVN